jgi:hypothetical protein
MKNIYLVLILISLNLYSQKQYKVEIRKEGRFYSYLLDAFDSLMQNFGKLKFDKALNNRLIDRNKITENDLIKLYKTIIETIPLLDSSNNIWIIYGKKNREIYYSKYLLGRLTSKKREIFFQINYYVNPYTSLIDSVNICSPINGCRDIKPLSKKMVDNPYDYYFNANQIIYNNTRDLKTTEEIMKQIEYNRTAIWTIDQ